MAKNIAPDTIFDHPAYNVWPLAASTDSILGGRLMSSSPHTDGLILMAAEDLASDNTNLVLTRTSAANWSLVRTATGAETYNLRCLPKGIIVRTGEKYYRGTYLDSTNPAASDNSAPPKGVELTDIFAVLGTRVVLPTTLTLALYSTVLPANGVSANVTVNTLIAPTSIIPAAVDVSLAVHTSVIAVPTPAFVVTDLSALSIELSAVLANTGLLAVKAIGAHVNFLYN